jgi:hypothetical protein
MILIDSKIKNGVDYYYAHRKVINGVLFEGKDAKKVLQEAAFKSTQCLGLCHLKF